MLNAEIKKQLEDLLSASIKNFEAEIFVLGKLGKLSLNTKIDNIRTLLLSISSTGAVISYCGKSPLYFPSEGIMLSRSFIEKIVNFTYLIYCDEFEFERFLLHPYYRQFHNLKSGVEVGDIPVKIIYTGINEYRNLPLVSKALSIFSENNSKLDWSKKKIKEKIKIINNEKIGNAVNFLMNNLLIYSNASEALHGSLYGITSCLGIYDPTINSKNKDEVYNNILRNLILTFANLTFLANEIFISLNKLKLSDNNSFQELYDISVGLCEPQMNILESMIHIK